MRHIALTLLLLTGCSSARVELYSATAIDLVTTRIGLNRGYAEASPIYKDFLTFSLSQVVINEAILAWQRHMQRNGNKHYRLPARIFAISHGLAAGWNTYQLTK
jgi:hypothetical protein